MLALAAGALGLLMSSDAETSVDASSAPDPVPSVLSGDAPDGSRVITLGVEGMRCGGCAHKLYTALLELPSVTDAAVDVSAQRAHAVVPAPVDVEQVAAAVSVPGLTLVPIE